MKLIRIFENDNFIIDYDKNNGVYRASIFNDGHFVDEYLFEEGKDKEVPMPIVRLKDFGSCLDSNYGWWVGKCPNCGKLLSYNYDADSYNRDITGNETNYCFNCGQLVSFTSDLMRVEDNEDID